MAKVGKNIVTTGFSGKLGLIVFRNRAGKTFVSTAPEKKERELTEAQKLHQKEFQEAILYGQSIIADPATKAIYESRAEDGESAFNVAVADFMRAPSIDNIDVTRYNGKVGSSITVNAVDDFKVAEVQIAIYNADGSLVESGLAVQQANKADWLFTATTANSSLEGDKVVVRVTDKPGNLTQKEKAL
ncbi:MAG TPA: hypothetical protein VHO90_19055 [Bacteroidales bacterium]|nr:hypothetical protein [Bacteroidales bacterium]